MFDLELVTFMSGITVFGLLVAGVMALGMTRAEKTLAAIYFISLGAMLITVNYFIDLNPDLETAADIDNWLNSVHRGRTAADILWWVSVCAAAGFLLLSVRHVWQERGRIIEHIRIR